MYTIFVIFVVACASRLLVAVLSHRKAWATPPGEHIVVLSRPSTFRTESLFSAAFHSPVVFVLFTYPAILQ